MKIFPISRCGFNKFYFWLMAVAVIEIVIAAGKISLPDRFCLYAQIIGVTALFLLKDRVNWKHLLITSAILLPLNIVLTIHAFYILGNGNGFNVENLFHLLQPGMFFEYFKMSPVSCIMQILTAFIAAMLPAAIAFTAAKSIQFRNRKILKTVMISGIVLTLFSCVPIYEISAIFTELYRSRQNRDLSPETLKKYGIKSFDTDQNEISATAGKNLIFIILESTERSYLDQKIFPGLLPELTEFAKNSQSFDNLSTPIRAQGTFPAIYAMFTGMLMTPSHLIQSWNPIYLWQLDEKFSSLPKILAKAGYSQHFFTGHSADFALMGNLIESQKFNELWFGADHRKTGNFAVHDSEVFAKAQEKFHELASGNKPFNLTLLTFDAHSPEGFHKPGEPIYTGSKELSGNLYNAMFASDHALGKFLRSVKSHPAAENCCIVIVSDHLCHTGSVSTPLLQKFPRRRMLFLINNSAKKEYDPEVPAMTFDIAPTVLSALGVKHNYQFPLGENLYAPTRPERLNNTPEQLQTLVQYIKSKSSEFDRFPEKVSVTTGNCVRLFAGKNSIVACASWPNTETLGYSVWEIPANLAIEPSRFRSADNFRSFCKLVNTLPGYIFFTGNNAEVAGFYGLDSADGYLLGIIFNGRKIIKRSDSPEKLFLSVRETAGILKK